jgi:hypothetical protein
LLIGLRVTEASKNGFITVAFVQIGRSEERVFVRVVPTYAARVTDDECRRKRSGA